MNLSAASIALVDDENDLITLFTDVIQMNGYVVAGFTNPFLLIDYIRENPNQIKLILIDYKMPHMTGCELANKIYAINPNIKMVLLSAYDNIINNKLQLEIIRKPMPIKKILEVVDKYMNPLVNNH